MRVLLFSLLLGLSITLQAETFTVPVADQEITITQYPADGDQLIIALMPRLADTPRVNQLAVQLAKGGVEVWVADLADSLFLPAGPASMRSIKGDYVGQLITLAHQRSNKNITLMSRGYAAIPVLRGARAWQKQATLKDGYFNGVILFSPDVYATIPDLGLPPIYEPIASATNIPMMIYQSGKRGNRWQLDNLMSQLQIGGAQVYSKVMPGVTGLFSDKDVAPETLKQIESMPVQLQRSIQLLSRIKTPAEAAPMAESTKPQGLGLDIQLKPYKGNPVPKAMDLPDAKGKRFVREDYRGKVTVMNFWATWCPPCVEEIPALNNLRQAMSEHPFELISVNYAEDKARIETFLKEVKVDFPVLLDSDGSVSAQWNVLVFPSTFVIGPDGKIVYGVNGAIHWDSPAVISELKALLK